MVGDRITDLIAGSRSGILNLIHVETGHGKKKGKILETLDKDKFICDSGVKAKIIFLKNLEYFPKYFVLEKK